MTGRAFRKLSDMGVSGASLVALKGVMPHLIHACGAMHSPRGVSHTPLTLVSDPSSAASLPAGAFATPPSITLAPWSVAKSERSDSSSRASGSDSLTALQVHDTCELEITIVCGADTHTQACTAQTPPQRCTFTQGVCREIDDEYGSARSIDEKMLQGRRLPAGAATGPGCTSGMDIRCGQAPGVSRKRSGAQAPTWRCQCAHSFPCVVVGFETAAQASQRCKAHTHAQHCKFVDRLFRREVLFHLAQTMEITGPTRLSQRCGNTHTHTHTL